MKVIEIKKTLIFFLFLIVMYSCHPLEWTLPRMDPHCPAVSSLQPSAGPAGIMVTVTGKNFDPNVPGQFKLSVGGTDIPIMEIKSETQLVFEVPTNLKSGEILVSREGCSGETQSNAIFTYHYSVTTSPFVYAGMKNQTSCTSCLNGPRGMDIDSDGNLYIADFEHQVVQKITPARNISIIAGQLNSSGDADNVFNGKGAKFANPSDVALDESGNIYVADEGNNKIRKIEIGGNRPVSTVSGASQGIIATYNRPTGIAFDKSNNRAFVVDYINGQLQMLDLNIGSVSTIGGSCSLSFPTGVDYHNNPGGSALLPIMVADFNNKWVRGFDLISACQKVPNVPSSPYSLPFDISMDGQGNVFVADQGLKKVMVIYSDGSMDEIKGYNFSSPTGILYDEASKSLFVADKGQHVIVKFGIE